MSVKASNRDLTISCKKHPGYRGEEEPQNGCRSCTILYVLVQRNNPDPKKRLKSAKKASLLFSGVHIIVDMDGLLVQPSKTSEWFDHRPREHDSFIDEPHADYRVASLKKEMRERLSPPSKKKELMYEDTKRLLIL